MNDKPDDVPALAEIGDGDDLPGYWAEPTTITVRRYTKQRLDDDRDGQPWDRYLEGLRRAKADPLTLSDAEEIAEIVSDNVARGDVAVDADAIAAAIVDELPALTYDDAVAACRKAIRDELPEGALGR